jgi:hypothetical protein
MSVEEELEELPEPPPPSLPFDSSQKRNYCLYRSIRDEGPHRGRAGAEKNEKTEDEKDLFHREKCT